MSAEESAGPCVMLLQGAVQLCQLHWARWDPEWGYWNKYTRQASVAELLIPKMGRERLPTQIITAELIKTSN